MKDFIWEYSDGKEWMKRVRSSSLPPMIVCAAITGGMHGKEMNINLPETPEEQAEQTHDAFKLGASIVHVHARDPEKLYQSSGNPQQFRLINALIREKCPDIIINNTTGGTPGMPVEARLAALDANPEIASLHLSTGGFRAKFKERKAPIPHPRPEIELKIGVDSPDAPDSCARLMLERGIKPEIEIFQHGELRTMESLVYQGLLQAPYLVQIVMGTGWGVSAMPSNLTAYIAELPSNSVWFVAAMGPFQFPLCALGIALGGNVRVGMEDNVYASRGQLLKDNAEAVERVIRMAKDMNREIATPAQAREMLGISSTPSKY